MGRSLGFLLQADSNKFGAAGLIARTPLILAIQMLRQPESFRTNPRQKKKKRYSLPLVLDLTNP